MDSGATTQLAARLAALDFQALDHPLFARLTMGARLELAAMLLTGNELAQAREAIPFVRREVATTGSPLGRFVLYGRPFGDPPPLALVASGGWRS